MMLKFSAPAWSMFFRATLTLVAVAWHIWPGFAQSGDGSFEDNHLAGLWLGLHEKVRFPTGCESDEPVRYSPDGTYAGPGARGTWRLSGGRLTETVTQVDPKVGGDPAAIGRPYISDIAWEGRDTFVKTFADGARMTFRRCPGVATPATMPEALPSLGAKRSKAADYLVREQIADACGGKGGTIDSAAVVERDLTGDGKADLIISHEGISCAEGGRSSFCGMQVCSVNIYVRRGALLKLEREMLGAGVRVGDGRIPAIHMYAHGGTPGSVKWNGRAFR